MNLYESFKNGIKTINELVNLTDVQSLINELDEANKKILKLENEINNLKLKDTVDKLEKKKNYYIDSSNSAYCINCFDLENKKVHVSRSQIGSRELIRCPLCGYEAVE